MPRVAWPSSLETTAIAWRRAGAAARARGAFTRGRIVPKDDAAKDALSRREHWAQVVRSLPFMPFGNRPPPLTPARSVKYTILRTC